MGFPLYLPSLCFTSCPPARDRNHVTANGAVLIGPGYVHPTWSTDKPLGGATRLFPISTFDSHLEILLALTLCPCTYLSIPSVRLPVLFYLLAQLSWSPPSRCCSLSLPSHSLLGISLLVQFSPPTHFMSLIPFLTVCLQVWGQVLICLLLFLPLFTSSPTRRIATCLL